MAQEFPVRLEVRVEVARWSFVKRDGQGAIDFISPLPCPFNYGSVPGTTSADGDAEDVVLLGPRLAIGSRTHARVLGRVLFVDAGRQDAKWICGSRELRPSDRLQIDVFFRVYCQAKRVLNAVRGLHGETRYAGIVMPGDAASWH